MELIDLPLRPIASSCTTNSILHPPRGHTNSTALSTMLLLEEMTYPRPLSSILLAATRLLVRAHLLFPRHR